MLENCVCAYKKGLRADQVCSDEHKQENLHCQLAIPTDKSFSEGRLKFVFFLWRGTTGRKRTNKQVHFLANSYPF